MSRERPILFNGDMVRAILESRKTMTRRVVKVKPHHQAERAQHFHGGFWDWLRYDGLRLETFKCPYGQQGDRLWVRETFADEACDTRKYLGDHIYYRADGDGVDLQGGFWTPSIYMPRWASRINLEITEVRVERLQDISEEDAKAEGLKYHSDIYGYELFGKYSGIGPTDCVGAIDSFRSLWESINGPSSWYANPWVWVIEFRRLP